MAPALEWNYRNASTHFPITQTSTSVWNNCRDQEVEFDWQTYASTVIEQLKRTFFTSQRQLKQFFRQVEIRVRIVCVLKISQSRRQQQRIQGCLKEIRW